MKTKHIIAALGLSLAMTLPSTSQSSAEVSSSDKNTTIALVRSSCPTPDGGMLLGGTSPINEHDFHIVKVDEEGNQLWEKMYGGEGHDELIQVQATLDGGYILGGLSESGISGNKSQDCFGEYDYWIVKIDASGEVEWDQTYGGLEKDHLTTLVQMPDGGYFLAGYSNSTSMIFEDRDSDFWIVRTDVKGKMIWEDKYGSKGTDVLATFTILEDGGFLMGGHTRTTSFWKNKTIGTDYQIIKTDKYGKTVWETKLGGEGNDYLSGTEVTPEGIILLSGYTYVNNQIITDSVNHWVVSLSAEGDVMPEEHITYLGK